LEDPKSTSKGSPRSGEDGEAVAVALDYDPTSTGSAPRVLATGRGAVAEQILELAFAHGVKVRQDADLVQILSAVDVDSEIPVEAFAAVAEILAYVYRANGQMAGTSEAGAAEPLSGDSAAAFAAAMADSPQGFSTAPPSVTPSLLHGSARVSLSLSALNDPPDPSSDPSDPPSGPSDKEPSP
jgi:flagellar biosynthesis protein